MKLITFFLLLFSLIVPTFLQAADKYIKVAKVSDDNQLLLLRSVLNEIGFTSTFTETKTNFVVFVGPFKNENNAEDALKRIQQHFIHAYIFEKEIKQVEKIVQEEEVLYKEVNSTADTIEESFEPSKENLADIDSDVSTLLTSESLFMNISLGGNLAPSEHVVSSGTIEVNLPSKYMISYGVEGGYSFESGVFFSLGALRSLDNDVVFTNAYATVNYRFDPTNDFAPFIGAMGGVSMLTWNSSPISDLVSSEQNSFSTIYGPQIGLIYVGCKNITLFTSYQYMMLDHVSDVSILTSSSVIQHKKLHNLNVGLGFNFSI